MSKLLTKQKGFSLIEATLAISIIIVGLLAVIQFFPLAIKIVGDSQNITTATSIALSKIEELSLLTYDNLSTGTIEVKQTVSSDPDSYLYHYQRETVVETIDSNFNTSVTDLGLKRIVVTVFWTSPIGKVEKSTQITTVVADY